MVMARKSSRLRSAVLVPAGKKRRMKRERSAGVVSIERQREENFRRHAFHPKPRGVDKAEALVITRVPYQAAAARAGRFQLFKPCPHQRRADTLALEFGQHGLERPVSHFFRLWLLYEWVIASLPK